LTYPDDVAGVASRMAHVSPCQSAGRQVDKSNAAIRPTAVEVTEIDGMAEKVVWLDASAVGIGARLPRAQATATKPSDTAASPVR
jgi:hypothetical protein